MRCVQCFSAPTSATAASLTIACGAASITGNTPRRPLFTSGPENRFPQANHIRPLERQAHVLLQCPSRCSRCPFSRAIRPTSVRRRRSARYLEYPWYLIGETPLISTLAAHDRRLGDATVQVPRSVLAATGTFIERIPARPHHARVCRRQRHDNPSPTGAATSCSRSTFRRTTSMAWSSRSQRSAT